MEGGEWVAFFLGCFWVGWLGGGVGGRGGGREQITERENEGNGGPLSIRMLGID